MKRYVGQTIHHIENSKHFTKKIKELKIEQDESLVSYDIVIVALYPPVLQDEALNIST